LAVVILAPRETAPAPVCVKAPERFIEAATFNDVLSEIDTGPFKVVVTGPKNEKADPLTDIPLTVLVDKAPLNVEVPVPADWVIEAAEIACVET
jgi:hypothetical protein